MAYKSLTDALSAFKERKMADDGPVDPANPPPPPKPCPVCGRINCTLHPQQGGGGN